MDLTAQLYHIWIVANAYEFAVAKIIRVEIATRETGQNLLKAVRSSGSTFGNPGEY